MPIVQDFPSEQPRVSVIIPTYNAASFLATAVRSVLAQTEPDLEILIVDDASRDNTLEVARGLAQEDARVRVCPMVSNGGPALARNHGMAEARGRWVAVLDADDWYAPSRLKTLLDAADQPQLDMVADDWISVDAHAGLYLQSPLPRQTSPIVIDLDRFLKACRPTAKGDYGMLKHIIRRSFLAETKIQYPDARVGEDFCFLLSYFLAGGKALLLNEAYYYYVEPFGAVSRKWAQAGRKRYKFEILVEINQAFLNKYADRWTPSQKRQMERRTQGWRALISFYQIREALAERRYSEAAAKLMRAPSSFWGLLLERGRAKVRHKLFGPSQKILGPADPAMLHLDA